MKWNNDIHVGDAEEVLKQMPSESIDMCATSPPYWNLRDYSVEGQLGLEPTPEEYVEKLVSVFREVKRVLKKSGTLWLNIGDSYASSGTQNIKQKDLVGVPWRVAFALQKDGWYLRNDIIWHKPNPMPESIKDRFTSSHEHIFMLSKNKRYFFDQDAVREPYDTDLKKEPPIGGIKHQDNSNATYSGNTPVRSGGRNKRDVWRITTKPFAPAHFAVFPPELPRTCIKAGCPPKVCKECGRPYERDSETVVEEFNPRENEKYEGGSEFMSEKTTLRSETQIVDRGWKKTCDCSTDETEPGIVLDPFIGAGTTGLVAKQLNRNWVGIDIKEEYRELALERIENGDKYMRRKERQKRKTKELLKEHRPLTDFTKKEVDG